MFDTVYRDRTGFDPAFLLPGQSAGRVLVPVLGALLARSAAPLRADRTRSRLDYHHYSVVMHRTRRFAIYSAANVDFGSRFELKRPKDVWRIDPRIDASVQVGESFYTHNQFDRGHLTRREDMEFGPDEGHALEAAADTCHWTNCTPQHARFNESAKLWQGLERHILEKAVARDNFRAQVITGPVFDAADPVLAGFPDSPYPLRYWKVVAAIAASGKLFATAYVLDQREVIEQFGVRAAPEIPFMPYKTFQTSIAEVERLTGLRFKGSQTSRIVALSQFDPLARMKGAPTGVSRSQLGPASESSYVELLSLDQVVVG